ncbi:hypothetical protein IVB18_11355 [Bradyrhizobium sp. 186]|uniref:hypothetical protein n=1 Tax=Bradyrhizobium sp. 186 TaxID=2782654 RepID=UPI0020017F5A|nr:hypothetical protein [Bradyrhizobium sp. 186]UPK37837.1 hypothetical protein IVB18_11355 [Bradyrhizobium sp. 186]
MADPRSYPGAPRWVKVSGIVVGLVALLLVVLIHVSGGHSIPTAGGLSGHSAAERSH